MSEGDVFVGATINRILTIGSLGGGTMLAGTLAIAGWQRREWNK